MGSASQGSEGLQGQEGHGHSTGEMQLILDGQGRVEPAEGVCYTQGQDLLQGVQKNGQAMDLN